MGFCLSENKLVQARWSGEAAWIPLGALDLGLNYENHTASRRPAGLLPGGYRDGDPVSLRWHVLREYRRTACRQPLSDHNRRARTPARLGRLVLWEGAQDIVFERI